MIKPKRISNVRFRDKVLSKVGQAKQTAAFKSAEVLADIIRANIKQGYQGNVNGERWAEIGYDYWERVGSTEGQVRTGSLLDSVNVISIGDGKFDVVVSDPKAVYLEHGGFSFREVEGDFVPPRPFFRPAVHYFEEHRIANSILMEEVEDELQV